MCFKRLILVILANQTLPVAGQYRRSRQLASDKPRHRHNVVTFRGTKGRFAPFFWGTQKRGLLLPKRAAALLEGTHWCRGGTGKAEAVKPQDAGISPKQCPEK